MTLAIINTATFVPDYAFTNVGYALAYSPFIFMAKYVHVYGLTFILGLIIAALSEIETNKKNVNIILKIYINKKYFKLLLFVLFFSSCFIFYKNDVYNQKVIGGDQSSRDRLEVMLSDSRVLVKKEDAGYIKILNKNNVNTQEVLKSYDLLVDGETRMSRTGMYNVSHVYDNINGVEYTNYKRFLMPFGEYLPHFFYFLKYINSEMFEVITARHTYTSVDNNKVWTYDGKRYATLLCSDAWSPVSVRDIKKQNPDVVILQRSERLFKNRSIYIANVNMWKMVLVQYIGVPVVDVNK